MNVLWLSEAEVSSLISMREAVALMEDVFRALALGRALMPPKVYLDFKEHQGDLRIMPAHILPGPGQKGMAGVKVVNSHARNPERGLPAVTAVIVLNDPETGMPLALMAAGALTALRTGAAGGLAARLLARPSSTVAGLVGCGRQAAAQLEALKEVFKIAEVRVAGATQSEAEHFCRSAAKGAATRFVACPSAREACEADIVATTTPARQVAVKKEWIRPGTHINAIGADAPGKQELESGLLTSARIFVDLAEQAFHSGEVNVPLSAGVLKESQIAGNLGEVAAGRKKGRLSDQDITIFDSTGLAVQDLAVARFVYEKALSAGKGTPLPF